jgi:hypothetical protein
LAPGVETRLAGLADREAAGSGIWRIHDASLRRAFDEGHTVEEVLEFLRRHSSTPLPQALEYLVADVARRHGRLRVGGATTYLRGDPAMVAGAVRSAAGRRLGLRELAPGVAVTGRSQRELLAALRKAGEAPLAEDTDGSPRPEGSRPVRHVQRAAPDRLGRAVAVRNGNAADRAPELDPAAAVARLRAGARSSPPLATTASFGTAPEGLARRRGPVPDRPGDRSVPLEVDHPKADVARAAIAPSPSWEKAPSTSTLRLTPLALWNARAAGLTPAQVTDALREHSRYPVPPGLLTDLVETMGRYGRLVLRAGEDGIELVSSDPAVLEEVVRSRKVAPHLGERLGPDRVAVPLAERGRLKQALLALGWPADDQAGYVEGAPLPIELLAAHAGTGERFGLRRYQRESVTAFAAAGSVISCPAGPARPWSVSAPWPRSAPAR